MRDGPELVETARQVGLLAGVTAALSGLALTGVKVTSWVDGRIEARTAPLAQRSTTTEARVTELERSHDRVAAAMESVALALREGTERLTTQIQRVADAHEETAATVNHIRGRLDSTHPIRQG